MKLFGLVVLVLAALAMLMGGASAAPKGTGGLKKGLRAIVSFVFVCSFYSNIVNVFVPF